MTTPELEIAVELERLEEALVHSAANQFALGQQYRMIEPVAGIPATILAAAADLTALASTTGRGPRVSSPLSLPASGRL